MHKNWQSCFFLTLPLLLFLSLSLSSPFLTLRQLLSSLLHLSNLQFSGVVKYELHWSLQKRTINCKSWALQPQEAQIWRWFPRRWHCLATYWQLIPSSQVGQIGKMATCDCVQPHCIIILLCAKRGEWSINILNCLNELKSFHHFSPYPLFLSSLSLRPAWEDSVGVSGWCLRRPSCHTRRHRLPDTLSSGLPLPQQ